MAVRLHTLAPLALLALLLACDTKTDHPIVGLQAPSFMTTVWSEWSEPVNLGATINSAFLDAQPNLSKDGLSLYFTSNRPGAGLNDLWVTQRDCEACPWSAPVNLGDINTALLDAASDLSPDGHALFFHSNRAGGQGGNDIYVLRRTNVNDDFGWGAPQPLGPEVNSAEDEQAPHFHQNGLYFTRGNSLVGQQNLYVAPVKRDGDIGGPAEFLSELSHAAGNDAAPSVRVDGRELFYHRAPTAGGLGAADIWTSLRQGASGSWAAPVNAGAPLSTAFVEQQPSLSHDGRTLVWASNRPGGFGDLDIWMSTRAPIPN